MKTELEKNFAKIELMATPENVSLARIIVAGFIAPLDPTLDEDSDIKTAVSEAVTNAIIHGYDTQSGTVTLNISHNNQREITIEVIDSGIGIADIDTVRTPLFTTKPDLERSGLGFTVMESFMDHLEIKSELGAGTTVILTKKLGTTQNGK